MFAFAAAGRVDLAGEDEFAEERAEAGGTGDKCVWFVFVEDVVPLLLFFFDSNKMFFRGFAETVVVVVVVLRADDVDVVVVLLLLSFGKVAESAPVVFGLEIRT